MRLEDKRWELTDKILIKETYTPMITFKNKGKFQKLDVYFKKSIEITKTKKINIVAEECIRLLSEATPRDTGLTASSWKYEIRDEKNRKVLSISNTNVVDGTNIAFVLDIGHVTNNGVWIEGRHYIEPAVRDAYNKILNNTWKELKRL